MHIKLIKAPLRPSTGRQSLDPANPSERNCSVSSFRSHLFFTPPPYFENLPKSFINNLELAIQTGIAD